MGCSQHIPGSVLQAREIDLVLPECPLVCRAISLVKNISAM